jgi:hypothetical protein
MEYLWLEDYRDIDDKDLLKTKPFYQIAEIWGSISEKQQQRIEIRIRRSEVGGRK